MGCGVVPGRAAVFMNSGVLALSHALSLLLRLVSVYFLLISLFGLRPCRRAAPAAAYRRLACLIAARNEEAVIGACVQSLLSQAYPRAQFDVWVIPNNCTDATAEAAQAAGARLFFCREAVRCKGDALRQAVGALLEEDYDAFCVFDADNLVQPGFLSAMNDMLAAGAPAVKGAMRVKNPGASWVSGCYGLYFTLFDRFFSRARMNCGLSAKLVGTGFAVSREALLQLGGWNTHTIAEDAEFSAQLVCAGLRVWFCEQAVTLDEAPERLSVSLRQRRRWSSGVMDVAAQAAPALALAARKTGSLCCADLLLMLLSPFTQALSLVPALVSMLCALQAGQGAAQLLSSLRALCAMAAGSVLFAALLASLGRYRAGEIWKSVLLFPFFMGSWLPLVLCSLFFRTRRWEHIAHGPASGVRGPGSVALLPRRARLPKP